MILFKVTHKHKLDNHWERKSIGMYSTRENACAAIENLKTQPGFCDTQNGFCIRKVFRITKPKLLDKTFWAEGFDTYTYYPGLDANEQRALELVKKYGFDFENVWKMEENGYPVLQNQGKSYIYWDSYLAARPGHFQQ